MISHSDDLTLNERPNRDLAALAGLTDLWRRIETFRVRPVGEKARLLEQLGLSPEEAQRVVRIFDEFNEIPPREPGLNVNTCELGWQPSVLAPVFYGIADVDPTLGAPARIRIVYPSVDGAPENAPLLEGCGRYPLVVFLHGQCGDTDHFRAWDILPAQLARSGYVVAIPELSSSPPWGESNPDVALVQQVLFWMRGSWEHAQVLLPPPVTAIVGHSWGALLGARVARQLQSQGNLFKVGAYVSLSGPWIEWGYESLLPLDLEMPTLFTWGTGSDDVIAALEGAAAERWQQPGGARHKLVFLDGAHWDYLPEGQTSCANSRGPCSLVGSLAADFVTTFLSHYIPPERWWLLPSTIPHSLIPPPLALTEKQQFFVGGHLGGLAQIGTRVGCSVTHTWKISQLEQGSLTLSGS